MSNIVDLDNEPFNVSWHAKVKRWILWQKASNFLAFSGMVLMILIMSLFAFGMVNVSFKNSEKINLLLTETSLQLQAISDGCLNKGGE